ncbi:MAG: HVA1 family protein [Chthoniobacterales bacterium]
MTDDFKVGDHVKWNSEAGRVRGTIKKKITSATAEYVLLRGLRRLDVYPGDDVGARNNLQRWLKLKKPLDYESVRRVIAKWQRYAGFIYFHLLLDGLTEAGHLPPGLPSKSD